MSIFSKIKDAIFGHKTATTTAPGSAAQVPAGQSPAAPTTTGQPQPQAQTPIDVAQVLTNIDLLKLLGIDSSLDKRKELATELGYTGDKDGSAEMNIWLHKAVMKQLATHGGMVSASLMD